MKSVKSMNAWQLAGQWLALSLFLNIRFINCFTSSGAFEVSRKRTSLKRRVESDRGTFHVRSSSFHRSTSNIVGDNDPQHNWELTLQSPCKINLFLRILGRRESGFHDLASLFQTVSLSDTLLMSKLPNGAAIDVLTCSDESLEVTADNLVIKALDLMRKHSGIEQFFKVHLQKEVPMQAGLGGGSGNAATAMHGFNALCGFPVSNEQLLQWSGEIGSDISFFFSSGAAYCTGRGEIVQNLPSPLPDAARVEVNIFKPNEGLSTAAVFKSLQLDQCSSIAPESILDSFRSTGALLAAAQGQLINDLEAPAFANKPQLGELKQAILSQFFGAGGSDSSNTSSAGIGGVMMSGSGTSVFALCDAQQSPFADVAVVQQLLSQFPTVRHYRCSFVSRDAADPKHWYSCS